MSAPQGYQRNKFDFDILVVEDDTLLNDQITELLANQGYSVTQCFDGDQALDLAVAQRFSLILLDVMLPGKDGLAVLNILRSCNNTPVIIVSAKHAEEERILGLSAGADDYLAKPVNTQMLLTALDTEQVPNNTIDTDIGSDTMSTERVEWEHINQVLNSNEGNVSATARQLGMHRRTLQRKLQKKPVSK